MARKPLTMEPAGATAPGTPYESSPVESTYTDCPPGTATTCERQVSSSESFLTGWREVLKVIRQEEGGLGVPGFPYQLAKVKS